MRTRAETRLECARMASAMVTSKTITAADLEKMCKRLFDWVQEEGEHAPEKLATGAVSRGAA